MLQTTDILHLIDDACHRLDADQSLGVLAARSGWSKFYLHRAFVKLTSETPKHFIQRLRIERAAAALVTGTESVLEVSLAAGYSSHEVFIRAFRRQFGCSPTQYRNTSLKGLSEHERTRHREMVRSVGPCLGLFHAPLQSQQRMPTMPSSTIERKQLQEQPILFIQRRIPATQLQPSMAECFGKLYSYGQKAGLAIAGQPIARYVSTGPGLWTVNFMMPLAAPAPAEGGMEVGFLPAGPVAFAVHMGPYEQLPETNAAIEKWIEDNALRTNGAPWESYVTDPGQTPDTAKWRTEIFWPLAE